MTLHDAGTIYWSTSGQYQADEAGEWGRIATLERIIGKKKYIDEIDDGVVAKFVARRRIENAKHKDTLVSNATVNRAVECLGRIFKKVRKIARMPEILPEWRDHKLPEPWERTRNLTHEEERRLFAAIDELRPDFRDMIDFALVTGKRLGEVIFLEKPGVDFRAMTARVVQKGGEEINIALTDFTVGILKRNWMHHPKRCFTFINQANKTYMNRGTMVVVRKGNRRPFTQNGWRKQWKAILEKAEITDFRFHDIRHTALSRVLAATGNLKAVQGAGDHKSIASSARYAHLDPAQKRASLEAAENLRIPEKSRNDPDQNENLQRGKRG